RLLWVVRRGAGGAPCRAGGGAGGEKHNSRVRRGAAGGGWAPPPPLPKAPRGVFGFLFVSSLRIDTSASDGRNPRAAAIYQAGRRAEPLWLTVRGAAGAARLLPS